MYIWNDDSRKVICTREDVAAFNAQWPGSELRDRSYWFEFDDCGDLIDTDVPEHDDGNAAKALSDDCYSFLFDDVRPDWLA